MADLFFELFLILLLMLANGLFSMSEIAMISARKQRLQQRAEDGDEGAKTALALSETPTRFLSTIQIGITLIGTLTGALGGATLSSYLAVPLAKIPFLAPYSNSVAFVLIVILITYFSLVIGELIPKRLALNDPEGMAVAVARPMFFLSVIGGPLVKFLSLSTDIGMRLLGVKPSDEPAVTEDDVKVLIEQGTLVGVFDEAEQDMVESVFRLGDRRVDALMTPRTEIDWIDVDEPFEDNQTKVLKSRHTRFPVAQASLDNVLGVLVAKDLLADCLVNQNVDLQGLLQPPLFVPESMPALKVMTMFKSSGTQLALVIDEYGGLMGMVTLYDLLEAIIGEITPEGMPSEHEAIQREDGSWLFGGMIQIDELKEILDLDELPGEDKAWYQTLGGFMMSQLGSIPNAGDHFEWEGWHFEVVDMDGRRVDKVLVLHQPPLPGQITLTEKPEV